MPVILRVCVAIELDRPLTHTTHSVNGETSRSASAKPVASIGVAPSLPTHRGSIQGTGYHSYASPDSLLPTPQKVEGAVETDARTLNCNATRRSSAAVVRESLPPSTIPNSAMCIGEEPHLSAAAAQKQHPSSSSTPFLHPALCRPHLQRESAPIARRHRSLLWLSIELGRCTTVGGVIQQIEDVVRRHVCARVYPGENHDPNTDANSGVRVSPDDTSSGLVLGNTKSCNHKNLTGPVYCDGSDSTVSLTLRLSPQEKDVRDDELCLCLQDQNSEYRWIGGAHHLHTMAVVQTPFLAEACLRSYALFEKRQHEQVCVPGRHPTASHSSIPFNSTAFCSHLGSSLYPATEGPCHVDKVYPHGDGPASDNSTDIPCAVPPGASGRESLSPASRVEDDAWREARARRGPPTPRSASSPKFAFLKGVVVPMTVLRQHNPRYARTRQHHPHGRSPRQYAKVRVPVDMQVETRDGFLWGCETTTAPTATAQPHQTSIHTYASSNVKDLPPSPADVSATGSVGDTTAQSPIATCSVNTSESPSRRENITLSTVPVHVPSTSAENVDTGTSGDQALDREHPPPCMSTVPIAPAMTTALGLSSLSPHATATQKTSDAILSVDAVHALSVQGMSNANTCEASTEEEEAALRALERAQYDYVAALTKYRATASYLPTDFTGVHHSEEKPLLSAIHSETELVSLMQRKMDLQSHIETCSKAERQCERLVTRAEYLKKELQEHQRGCELLTQLCHRNSNDAHFGVERT